MKKFLLPALGLLLSATAIAQTPEKKSLALVHKITATWCGPCGSWGWDLADEIKTATSAKALYWNLYASSSPSMDNTDFYNTTAGTIAQQITFGGYPDFGVNAIEKTSANTSGGGINPAGIKTDCIAAVDAFAATVPVASPASDMSSKGDSIIVNAKVQFWAAASGEYYLASYIVEEGALHIQNGQTGAVAHHGVLRTSMSAGSAWGEQIATGSIPANQTYTKVFKFKVTDAKWDKAKFKIYNVIWKKEGSVYKYVNASLGKGVVTGLDDLLSSASLTLSPNPTRGSLTISFDALKSGKATYTFTDISGRNVLPAKTATLKLGNNQQEINTTSLTPGLYFLSIQTAEGAIQKKFVKQ